MAADQEWQEIALPKKHPRVEIADSARKIAAISPPKGASKIYLDTANMQA